MNQRPQKITFLFPGQGAQYPGMGNDFYHQFPIVKKTFEEADDILKRDITSLILNGSETELTETQNSQIAIFVVGVALQRLLQKHFGIIPSMCSGLSLGEYTGLTAGGWLTFEETLPLIQKRGELMSLCCQKHPGSMSVIIGLSSDDVQDVVGDINLPEELFIANYNCPGQVVISGTLSAIGKAAEAAKEKGAKRVLPLQVHGAFHSGLMKEAQDALESIIQKVPLVQGYASLVMNVTGREVNEVCQVRECLQKQITHSVLWNQGILTMENLGVDLYIEFGPGKTLSGMNKRIGVKVPTITIDKIDELKLLERM